ncbi:MAG TPA: helical backbone metal receptor [Micromonosporaceae bacterium]
MRDDLGDSYDGVAARVVSLVPSLTEAVASVDAGVLVGATDYCVHPASLDVTRVGGSKFPNLPAILDLRPDLILANVEENRRSDVDELRAAGIPVWVTYPKTVDEALASLRRMFGGLRMRAPAWLDEAVHVWASPATPIAARALVPVWRRPWVVLGSDTFAGDVLHRLGVTHLYRDDTERYPRPALDELRSRDPDLLVLPDEPYAFTAEDGPEAFPDVPYALVSGRHLTWYGPTLVEAHHLLTEQLVHSNL